MDLPQWGHDPVLIQESLDLLNLRPGVTVVDCTVGRGGHASEIAQRIGPRGLLIALDADPYNLEDTRARLAESPCPVRFFHANFSELSEVLEEVRAPSVDAILADLGLSTNQFFDPRYGLSFTQPMPLDMRFDPRMTVTAADLVNKLSETELANVLYNNAQERYSRRIVKKIAAARRFSPITTTDQLAELVRSALPPRDAASRRIDPATKTFLALRMEVNREIENLRALLEQAPLRLASEGRIAVISFQSTEDRLIKHAFRSAEQAGILKVLTKKPITPAEDELARNPRSRSAKLRAVQKE